MIHEEIGKKIQRAREEAGLSQGELASRLGYTQAALSNYELGRRQPGFAKLELIARELGKPLSYFFEEQRTPPDADDARLDENISEMIELWCDMPEDERKYLLDFIRWRRSQQR